jgi:low molecular weight protein-tyrosine phosphatase
VRILFVCTGNLCRSALAEWYLRGRVGRAVEVASAGVHAPPGYPMDPPTAQALAELGGDGTGHVSRRLVPEYVRAADLVLGAAAGHRDDTVRLVPAALHRTFTIREFLRLSAGLADGGVEAVRAAARQRGRVTPPRQPYADDIGDPFGYPLEVARLRAREVADAVDRLIEVLGLSSAAR